MVKSMTAYARQEEKILSGSISMEMRSVNHRFLEMNIKMPDELRALEMTLRERIKAAIKRGKLDISLRLQLHPGEHEALHFNRELAEQLAKTLHDIDKLIYNAAPVNAVDILNWPGVMDSTIINPKLIKEALHSLLDRTMDSLLADKHREGQALQQMISQRVTQMRAILVQLRTQMPKFIELQKERLEQKLQQISIELDSERLEQEMVYIAQKADVAEELDRLDTHLDEIERSLSSEDAIGRRLDFLMQELNREANTLGSKSIAADMTRASVEMKVLIEQMREQIQNIE